MVQKILGRGITASVDPQAEYQYVHQLHDTRLGERGQDRLGKKIVFLLTQGGYLRIMVG
jgi:hypothetical protein